jgi:hypothetical protein
VGDRRGREKFSRLLKDALSLHIWQNLLGTCIANDTKHSSLPIREGNFAFSVNPAAWLRCAPNDTLKNFCLPKTIKRSTLGSFGHFASM